METILKGLPHDFWVWLGSAGSVLVGACLNHRLTQNREEKKWLRENFIASLKKCMLLLIKIKKHYRHLSVEGKETYITLDPNNPKDAEIVMEMCAEIETEIKFLIIHNKLFGDAKNLFKQLDSVMEEVDKDNELIIQEKFRETILEILLDICRKLN